MVFVLVHPTLFTTQQSTYRLQSNTNMYYSDVQLHVSACNKASVLKS
jgi:hypothetical protein